MPLIEIKVETGERESLKRFKKYICNKYRVNNVDELDRNNCLPSDEVRAVMNKWIEMKECA